MTERKRWTQSYSGSVITPLELLPEQVHFPDIPHTLAQKVRFNGHLRVPGYTVAQHCVLGAEQIAGPFALAFLLHEVSEVYLPDIPSPIKPMLMIGGEGDLLESWAHLESRHADAVFKALGLSSIRPLIDSPEVHLMDMQMLMTEKRDLMGPEPEPWGIDVAPLDSIIIDYCWDAKQARTRFTDLYYKLIKAHGSNS